MGGRKGAICLAGGGRGAVSCGSRTASRWPPTSPSAVDVCNRPTNRPILSLSPLSLLVLCYYYLRRPHSAVRKPARCLSVGVPPLLASSLARSRTPVCLPPAASAPPLSGPSVGRSGSRLLVAAAAAAAKEHGELSQNEVRLPAL